MAIAQQTINISEQLVDNVNILERWPFKAVPITIDLADMGVDSVPAGCPIDANGGTSDAPVGILLHDVYADMPVGSIVVEGFINVPVAEAHVSAATGIEFTYSAEVKAALPNIHFGFGGLDGGIENGNIDEPGGIY